MRVTVEWFGLFASIVQMTRADTGESGENGLTGRAHCAAGNNLIIGTVIVMIKTSVSNNTFDMWTVMTQ